jgi:hypothetical protein
MTTISTTWQNFRKLPLLVFSLGITTSQIASSVLTTSEVIKLINPDISLQHEGWILTKITGVGLVSYDSNLILDYINWRANLSRSSKITTIFHTTALPTVEQTTLGNIKDSDVSAITNLDFQGHLKGQINEVYRKIYSQTFQSHLVLAQQTKTPLCLYVGGTRDGKKSTFLNIIKMKVPNKSAVAKLSPSNFNSFSKDSKNVAVACDVKGEPVLERVDK